jgi:UDP-2,3-diacylglucosamine pyrophosphatase LpxH
MTILIHDLHLGAQRTSGVTPESGKALNKYLCDQFETLLNKIDEPLIILGDLFDSYQVPNSVLLSTHQALGTWLSKGHQLTLVIANHDTSNDSSKLSSFELLAELLACSQVTFVYGGYQYDEGTYIVSHVTNQAEFDEELAKVPKCKYLLLHTNYASPWAQSDHSLNTTEEQVKTLPADFVYFAHEHHARIELGGKVVIGGNNFPSSISDCLGGDHKYMHRITETGFEKIKTWDASGYAELDWRSPAATDAKFIRLVGNATAEEGVAVANTIANYRKSSEAFVVGNAVKIESVDDESIAESLESVKAFDVMAALREILTAEEIKKLESLNVH